MELVNTHCHSRFCGHGYDEIDEYVAEAKKAGLTTLAFTEHYPLTEAFDPVGYLSVTQEDLPAYIAAVKRARDENPDLNILLGAELDYLGKDEDRTFSPDEFDGFDLILGSVHFVDAWPFDDPAQRGKWEEEGAPDAIWTRYGDLWCDAASDPSMPFHVMSHPDLAKKFDHYPSFNLQPLYDRMAEAAVAGNRMIELNTSGAYYLCKEVFPAPQLLKTFCRAGVPCTVGTDSHEAKYVARDIQKAYKTLYEAGYRELTVPTRGGGRRSVALT